MTNPFSGVIVALVTPFKGGSIDLQSFKKIIHHCLDNGIDGLMPCGTTGESPTLSDEERFSLIQTAVKEAKGKVPVLAGAGSNHTQTAIRLARLAKEAGADGHLQVVPYYNKPPQNCLIAHFLAIADSVDLPLMLYNVPSRTVAKLEPETTAVLAKHKNIIGIKEAGGNIEVVSKLKKLCPQSFGIYSGEDALNLEIYKSGGAGTVSVVANVWPSETSKTWDLFRDGKLKEAQTSQDSQQALIKELFHVTNPMPAKAAMHLLGLCENELRLPLMALGPEGIDRMRMALKGCGVL